MKLFEAKQLLKLHIFWRNKPELGIGQSERLGTAIDLVLEELESLRLKLEEAESAIKDFHSELGRNN